MSRKTPLKRIEKLALAQSEAQIRIALTGAVFFAVDHKKEFAERYGEYGLEGLERLMAETVN